MTPDPLAALFAELGRLSRPRPSRDGAPRRGYRARRRRRRGRARFSRGTRRRGRGDPPGATACCPGLDDSKKLDAGAREQPGSARSALRAVAFGVGVVEARRDRRAATSCARAWRPCGWRSIALRPRPDALLVDAVRVPGVRLPAASVVHGDALSVLDRRRVDRRQGLSRRPARRARARGYPVYGFEHHKGYGTPEHWDALAALRALSGASSDVSRGAFRSPVDEPVERRRGPSRRAVAVRILRLRMAANREQILQSAEKLLSRGKLDQALKEYLRVLEDNPKDISTLNKVGDLYVRMNRPAESIPYLHADRGLLRQGRLLPQGDRDLQEDQQDRSGPARGLRPARRPVPQAGPDPGRAQPVPGPRRSLPEEQPDPRTRSRSTRRWPRSTPTTCGSRRASRTSTGRQPDRPGGHAVRADRVDAR